MAPPLGFQRTPSLAEQIRQMVQSEHLARAAAEAGAETFEEADDFDVADDYDPASPWEGNFDKSIDELNREEIAEQNAVKATKAAKKTPAAEPPPAPAEQAPEGATGGEAPPPKP